MSFLSTNMKISGRIVGIGVNHTDGSSDFKWLDKPIHNKITSVGLDFLLTFDGVSDYVYYGSGGHVNQDYVRNCVIAGDFAYYSTHRAGCCQFLKIGTNGDRSEFEDTDLKAPHGGLSDTNKTGANFAGTYVNIAQNEVLGRITRISVPATSDITVREIGFFGRGYNTNNEQVSEPMFSRIVLDTPLDLYTGETLTVCYEIRFLQDLSINECSAFNGLMAADGTSLRCFSKQWLYSVNTNTYGGSGNCLFWFNNGGGGAAGSYSGTYGIPSFIPGGTGIGTSYGSAVILYSTSDREFPSTGDYDSGWSSAPCSCSYNHYTGFGNNDKHRDITIELDFNQPGMTGATTPPDETYIDIKALKIFGRVYRMGYYESDGTTWHSQSMRKFGNQKMRFIHRLRFSTVDTI